MFTPDRSNITNITQALPAVVTTQTDHGLFNGNVVRLIVPPSYGMFNLNNLQIQIQVLSDTTFSCFYSLYPQALPVDSRSYPAFVTPTMPGAVSSVIPMGSGPTPQTDTPWQINNNSFDSPIDDAVLNNSTSEIPF
jgi:hypothetical protein